ncbi:hypothetical protein N7522_003111 [Penicillium canescens]|nr:hypothetical protein N7522_003111 [Penicillium canescens]
MLVLPIEILQIFAGTPPPPPPGGGPSRWRLPRQANKPNTKKTEAEEQAARGTSHVRLLDRLLGQVTRAEEAVEHAAFETEIAHIKYARPVGAGLNGDIRDGVNEDALEGWDADEQGPPSPRDFDAVVAHDSTGSN